MLQIGQMVTGIGHWVSHNDLTAVGQRLLASVNEMLARVPFANINLTTETGAHHHRQGRPERQRLRPPFARDSVGNLASLLTSHAIIFPVCVPTGAGGQRTRRWSGCSAT